MPTPAAETYTAHSTAIPAVQFNTAYLTPCTTVPSISFGTASDKRYSLDDAGFFAVCAYRAIDKRRLLEVADPVGPAKQNFTPFPDLA